MADIDLARLKERYDAGTLAAIKSSLVTLELTGFFEFVVQENNRVLVESYSDDNITALAEKIRRNRETNRVLLGIQDITTIVKQEVDNA